MTIILEGEIVTVGNDNFQNDRFSSIISRKRQLALSGGVYAKQRCTFCATHAIYRLVALSTWTTAGSRIQQSVDFP